MKRAISVTICAVMIFMLLPITVFASDYKYIPVDYTDTEAYQAVCEGVSSFCGDISILEYNISLDDCIDMMDQFYYNEPQFFYYEDYMIYFSGADFNVARIVINYKYTAEEAKAMSEAIDKELDAVISNMPENLDDVQKALYLKDYICVNYEYDDTYTSRDLYSMVTKKKGVCQGYVYLYDALLKKVGIESRPVSSKILNHSWNQIRLNGKWYHVDVTWCDPYPDYFGNSENSYFLLSDDGFDKVHNSYAMDIQSYYPCTDTRFDNLSWHSFNSSSAFANGKTYMSDGREIFETDLYSGNAVSVYQTQSVWTKPSGAAYPKKYIDLGSCNNLVIFNTDKEIKSFNPESGKIETLVSPDLGTKNIYGMIVVENTVKYFASDFVSDALNILIYEIPEIEEILGDIDGDGILKAVDYLKLKKAVLGTFELPAKKSYLADVNCDNKLNVVDYLMLKKTIMS